ncbi:hypothetical protein RJ639_009556 [Escallonia herrerae]|uniref:Reverse transcriptase domain-containing protein n=1 Tax=Escallonia herrerae TaxID=1293975 RepID=A0AA88VSM2_9ASTE|nr:hypothetical protein RJ639_009556 [Escallonia herrerae]
MHLSGGRRRSPPTTPTMLVLSRNCRGLGTKKKFRALRRIVRKSHPEIIFLSETKISPNFLTPILSSLEFHNHHIVAPINTAGGLCLAWKLGVNIEIVSGNATFINAIVFLDPSSTPWMLSAIYGPPYKQSKSEFWNSLRQITEAFARPWLAIGDFNEVIASSEKRGGRDLASSSSGGLLKILASSDPIIPPNLEELILPSVSAEDNLMLCSIPKDQEIKLALNQLGSYKAPGPDGMTGLFYKTYWDTIKQEVRASVKSFFISGHILREQNHTNIALIPKIESPTSVNHYRPISLCNMSYKIISTILASRLKSILHKLISPLQAAFVSERLISDNSILVQEIWHTMRHKKGKNGLMAIKLDMEKAYDKMECPFFVMVLKNYGFDQRWGASTGRSFVTFPLHLGIRNS